MACLESLLCSAGLTQCKLLANAGRRYHVNGPYLQKLPGKAWPFGRQSFKLSSLFSFSFSHHFGASWCVGRLALTPWPYTDVTVEEGGDLSDVAVLTGAAQEPHCCLSCITLWTDKTRGTFVNLEDCSWEVRNSPPQLLYGTACFCLSSKSEVQTVIVSEEYTNCDVYTETNSKTQCCTFPVAWV